MCSDEKAKKEVEIVIAIRCGILDENQFLTPKAGSFFLFYFIFYFRVCVYNKYCSWLEKAYFLTL